jgi:hypothetical protein
MAIVYFATPDATHTALLLSNAHIIDRAIQVEPHEEAKKETVQQTPTQEPDCPGIDAPPQTFMLPNPNDAGKVVTIEEVDDEYVQRNYGCTPDSMRVCERLFFLFFPFFLFPLLFLSLCFNN